MNQIRDIPIPKLLTFWISVRLEQVASRLIRPLGLPAGRVRNTQVLGRVRIGGAVSEKPCLEVRRVEEVAAEDPGVVGRDVESRARVIEFVDCLGPLLGVWVVEVVLRAVAAVGDCYTGEFVAMLSSAGAYHVVDVLMLTQCCRAQGGSSKYHRWQVHPFRKGAR